jgi:hypothetical protein
LKVLRFVGVSLSGGKNEKTCITTIDYYPQHHKVFLKEIKDKIPFHNEISQDKNLLEILNDKKSNIKLIGIDSPLTLPVCLTHHCGGVEKCKSPAVKWMWTQYKRIKKKRKNLKVFTPYTERPVERHINYDMEEFFEIPEALGANKAPLTARSVFLKSKIKPKIVEVFPRLSIWRMGIKFDLPKIDLKNYRHSIFGMDCRAKFLQAMVDHDHLFIYDQDMQKLVENPHAFDSMIIALTAYLAHFKQCEKPPKHFPVESGWIEFPENGFSF